MLASAAPWMMASCQSGKSTLDPEKRGRWFDMIEPILLVFESTGVDAMHLEQRIGGFLSVLVEEIYCREADIYELFMQRSRPFRRRSSTVVG
mmetsp:Transcript_17898/g.45427  ORF Transcript_17898/g.45427 Transcript_17898/m.45427 type:complete len:92 (+) Transcript_17898:500-775(+)